MAIALTYTPRVVPADRRRRVIRVTDVSMIRCAALHWFVDRRRLTAQERANLALAYAGCRPAVFTTSLGGHCFSAGRW